MSVGVAALGWPQAWRGRSLAVWAVVVFVVLIALELTLSVTMLTVLLHGDGLGKNSASVVTPLVLVPTLAAQIYVVCQRFRRLPRELRGDAATPGGALFLPDRAETIGALGLAVTAALFVLHAALSTVQGLELAHDYPVLWVSLGLEWVIAVALVLGSVWYVWTVRVVHPGLEIGPSGVRRRTSWSEANVPWDALARVDPERGRRLASWLAASARIQRRRVGLFASAPRESDWALPLYAARYQIDVRLLLAALRFYQLHPELRVELDSTAARDRIRRADFLGISLGADPGVPRTELLRYCKRGPIG